MTSGFVDDLLAQAAGVPSVAWIYFEGGEPFLAYPTLVHGVEEAHRLGFHVGVVTNAFWATSLQAARRRLEPLAERVEDLSISADEFHADLPDGARPTNAVAAAESLGLPARILSVNGGGSANPNGGGGVMFRGRAAVELAPRGRQKAWQSLDLCRHERLANPRRVHIDPLGNVHVCQGVVIGRLGTRRLAGLLEAYEPKQDPVIGPLVRGGPAELARVHGIAPAPQYADSCHLCYDVRRRLRPWFPEVLTPPALYGEIPA
jgi:hypothetical protein